MDDTVQRKHRSVVHSVIFLFQDFLFSVERIKITKEIIIVRMWDRSTELDRNPLIAQPLCSKKHSGWL